ncbi:MAG: hypothetical protein ACOCXT_04780, partial [Candidatus Dojkabacteria bacterium]
TLTMKGQDRGAALIEMPTYYFEENYRTYTFIREGKPVTKTFPPGDHEKDDLNKNEGNFITVEDSKKPNSAITIAWYWDETSSNHIRPSGNRYGINVTPFEGKDYVKFNNVVAVDLKENVPYKFRYVLLPYRYDEQIDTEFGRMSVQELVTRLDYAESAPVPVNPSQLNELGPEHASKFISTATDSTMRVGAKSGTAYSKNDSVGRALFNVEQSGRRIKRIEFDYKKNYAGSQLFGSVTIPGSINYAPLESTGVGEGRVSVNIPANVQWVGFNLVAKEDFTYPHKDNEWFLEVSNIKAFYYSDPNAPPPTQVVTTEAPQPDPICTGEGLVIASKNNAKSATIQPGETVELVMTVENPASNEGGLAFYNKGATTASSGVPPGAKLSPLKEMSGMNTLAHADSSTGSGTQGNGASPVRTFRWKLHYNQLFDSVLDLNNNSQPVESLQVNGYAGNSPGNSNCVVTLLKAAPAATTEPTTTVSPGATTSPTVTVTSEPTTSPETSPTATASPTTTSAPSPTTTPVSTTTAANPTTEPTYSAVSPTSYELPDTESSFPLGWAIVFGAGLIIPSSLLIIQRRKLFEDKVMGDSNRE